MIDMSSISLEAFDANVRGKYTQWILPSHEFCALPNGFQDQILSGTPAFQCSILIISRQDSKAWLVAYTWDMMFTPDSPNEWSLLLSILQHLKKPTLIVTGPRCAVPSAFWQKCSLMPITPTCVSLKYIDSDTTPTQQQVIPNSIFFPKLDIITESQFLNIPSIIPPGFQQSIQSLDLRSLYKNLRGAGASLCLSLTDSRSTTTTSSGMVVPSFNATWFYPESNSALRLNISDLRMILRSITERLAGP